MADKSSLSRRLLIDKANQLIVVVTSVAVFVTVFSLVASKTLLAQSSYQNRIIKQKKLAETTLASDLTNVQILDNSYQAFNNSSPNIIGGNPTGTAASDGTNSKLILDALPAFYDFPELLTTVQDLMATQPVIVNSISGIDNQLTESANSSNGNPTAVPMVININVTGNTQSIAALITTFQNSIRPFQFQSIDLSGSDSALVMTASLATFFQPGKTFGLSSEVVK